MRRVAIFLLAVLLTSGATGSLRAAEKSRPLFTDEKIAALHDIRLFVLGKDYAMGRGVKPSLAVARRLFDAAFRRDSEWATGIGVVYADELKDFATASHWYERGAAAGVEHAVDYLGFLYDKAKEHPLPDQQELIRLRQSVDGFSAIRLGHMYLYGWNVTRDSGGADKWFRKALRKGHIRLRADLGDYTVNGWLGNHDIAVRALTWYLAAAHFGNTRARQEAKNLSSQMIESLSLVARRRSQQLTMELKPFDVEIFPFP